MTATAEDTNIRLVLFLTNILYGGLGRIMSDVSCRLPKNVIQTVIVLEDKIMHPYAGQLRILGQNCLKRLPVRGLRLVLNALKFRRVIKELRPDAVLCFHHDARLINFAAKLSLPFTRYRTNIAVLGIPTQYEKYFPGSKKPLHKLMVRSVLRHADRIIAITEGVKEDLVAGCNVDRGKIHVVYGSVDFEKAVQLSSEAVEHPWFSENFPIIALSGRLVFEKGHADLLKAFALVRKKLSCRLVLVGDGAEQESLTRLAESLGISNDVLFLGYQKNPFKFIAKSSIFAFTSLFDAQGLVIIEAMAVGCPVVAYDCPVGPREMIAPGTRGTMNDGIEEAQYGLLVPAGNVDLLAKGIVKLLENSELRARYSSMGIERAKQFGAQDMADKYLKAMTG